LVVLKIAINKRITELVISFYAMKLMDFTGKKIVITGVGGIGLETAVLISKLGARVSLIDINESALTNATKKLGESCISSYECDFSDVNSISALVKRIVKEIGSVDGFVFCAGITESRPIKIANYDSMKRVMDINYFSYVEFIRNLTLKGNYNEGMSIVGISSVGAFLGNPAQTAYAASKAAMNGATRCLAKELAPKGIRVNTIAPGTTDTPMFRQAAENHSDSEAFLNRLERQYLGLCKPIDIANGVAFLLSNMSSMITGSCLGIDGGKLSS